MKGLTLHHMEKRSEAWQVAKLGLMSDLQSQICELGCSCALFGTLLTRCARVLRLARVWLDAPRK